MYGRKTRVTLSPVFADDYNVRSETFRLSSAGKLADGPNERIRNLFPGERNGMGPLASGIRAVYCK